MEPERLFGVLASEGSESLMPEVCLKGMHPWKNHIIVLTMAVLSASFPLFLVTGYTALYWTWVRGNLEAALPYLPWARNFGMLAMVGAAVALGILFSSNTFPISPKIRLWLSVLATATISLFSEFRNDGKFYFKRLVHFFGPGTWIHDGLNQVVSSLGDFLYRIEYSHWNDFLMGPAIVSVSLCPCFRQNLRGVPESGPDRPECVHSGRVVESRRCSAVRAHTDERRTLLVFHPSMVGKGGIFE